MPVQIALLRGVNVGGNNKLPMRQFAATLEELGLQNVRTYIQSGNVVFRAATSDAGSLCAEVETAFEARWGFAPENDQEGPA